MQKKALVSRLLKDLFTKKLYLVICIFVTAFLVYQWFNNANLLATAEEALPFYKLSRTFSLYKSLWIETEFGFSDPFYIPRLVLYGFGSLLQFIGLPSFLYQKFIFFVLLLTPLITMPKLVEVLFPKKEKIYGYIVAFFYLFNLFTLSQVFERFIYPLMFLWSYLPLFLLLWIKFIEEKKIKFLFYLILTSFIYSDTFGLTSSFLTLSAAIWIYTGDKILFEKNKLKTFFYSAGGFITWFIFQLWWIYPIWVLRNATYSGFLNPSSNLESLKEVSQYFPTSQIIFLKQGYFFGEKNFLYPFYNSNKIEVLVIIILIFVLVGIVVSFKTKKWSYLFLLLFIGWFVSKGYNPPFGDIFYQFIFSKLSFTQILRNPYEKFGVVWLLPYAIFFSFGLVWISEKLKSYRYIFIGISLFLLLGYVVKPLWTGDLFSWGGIKVTVPSYYEDANKYLDTKDSHRLLQLPLLQEPDIQYTWGYRGEEPSEFLFDSPSLSRSDLGSPHDDFYLSFPKYFSNKNFTKILEVVGISGIVVHHDTIQNRFNQESIFDYESHIQSWKHIGGKKTFGDLDVFTLNNKVEDWIYPLSKTHSVKTVTEAMNYMVQDDFNPHTTGVFILSRNADKISFPKNMDLPKIIYTKESPTHYAVQVAKAKTPFILVLSMTYNKLWVASINKSKISKHFEINGFANGWLVDKKGNYTISITFN